MVADFTLLTSCWILVLFTLDMAHTLRNPFFAFSTWHVVQTLQGPAFPVCTLHVSRSCGNLLLLFYISYDSHLGKSCFSFFFYFIGFLPRVSPFWTFFNLRGIHISESPFFCFTLHVTCTLQSRSAVFTLCAMNIAEILFLLLIWVGLTIEKSSFYCFHIASGLHFAEYYF